MLKRRHSPLLSPPVISGGLRAIAEEPPIAVKFFLPLGRVKVCTKLTIRSDTVKRFTSTEGLNAFIFYKKMAPLLKCSLFILMAFNLTVSKQFTVCVTCSQVCIFVEVAGFFFFKTGVALLCCVVLELVNVK